MSFSARAAASVSRLQRHFAGANTVELRRHNTLRIEGVGGAPALTVNGTTALGSSSISLEAASVVGVLRRGAKFTILGNATTYTVDGVDVEAASDGLAGVSVTPVIAAEAADGAAVTITQSYGAHSYPAVRPRTAREQLEGSQVDSRRWQMVLTYRSDLPAPRTGDFVHDDSAVLYVHDVETVDPGGSPVAGYVLTVGAR